MMLTTVPIRSALQRDDGLLGALRVADRRLGHVEGMRGLLADMID
jgi:hypothetical protein